MAQGTGSVTAEQRTQARHLRLVLTTDSHGTLGPVHGRSGDPQGLLAMRESLARLRTRPDATLLLDNGDMIQGDAEADWHGQRPGALPPIVRAMDQLGCRAATVGNHDLDFGLDRFAEIAGASAFPWLSANLHRTDGRADSWQPWVMLDVDLGTGPPLRLGLFGVTPPQTIAWAGRRLAGSLRADPIVPAAARAVADLRDAGADLVVGLCHTGPGRTDGRDAAENAGRALAALDGIDALVLGHSHGELPAPSPAGTPGAVGRLLGRPAVQPPCLGRGLGVIDIEATATAARWDVTGITARSERLVDGPPLVVPGLDAAKAEATAALDDIVGHTTGPLFTHFALCGPDPATALVAQAQAEVVRRAARGTPAAELPLVSVAAPFHVPGPNHPETVFDLPAGPIRLRDLHDLHGFNSEITAAVMSGRDLIDWAERSAEVFATIPKGAQDAALLGGNRAGYLFDVIHGAAVTFDLSQPAGCRVSEMTLNGVPVAKLDAVLVAMTAYRRGGGGGVAAAGRGTELDTGAPIEVREALARLLAQGPVTPDLTRNWHIAPLGATALVPTGPGAAAHLHHLPDASLVGDGQLRLAL